MAKKTNGYVADLRKMVQMRTGVECEPWLLPQLRATAMNMVMLDKIQDELERESSLILTVPGSMGQVKMDAHPLLSNYDKLQRTLIQQFEALGLNYKTTPSKVKEDTKKGLDDNDPLAELYKQAKIE
jgi:hypothetical protein